MSARARIEATLREHLQPERLDVIDDFTLAIAYIGSVQVPAAWGDISGAFATAFTEWFTFSERTSCLEIPRVTAFFGTPGYARDGDS